MNECNTEASQCTSLHRLACWGYHGTTTDTGNAEVSRLLPPSRDMTSSY